VQVSLIKGPTLRIFFFAKENPNAIIVQHYGGSGLLMSEICTALDDLKKKSVTINNTSFFFIFYLFF
jgi:hypothetical protein